MRGLTTPIRIQLLLVMAVGGLGLLPPANGFMLVLPTTLDPAATLDWVMPAGGLIVAEGPYQGAFVIAGDRATILPAAIRHGAIVLTASFQGCGTPPKDVV